MCAIFARVVFSRTGVSRTARPGALKKYLRGYARASYAPDPRFFALMRGRGPLAHNKNKSSDLFHRLKRARLVYTFYGRAYATFTPNG